MLQARVGHGDSKKRHVLVDHRQDLFITGTMIYRTEVKSFMMYNILC